MYKYFPEQHKTHCTRHTTSLLKNTCGDSKDKYKQKNIIIQNKVLSRRNISKKLDFSAEEIKVFTFKMFVIVYVYNP
jgi:hypothetical protein